MGPSSPNSPIINHHMNQNRLGHRALYAFAIGAALVIASIPIAPVQPAFAAEERGTIIDTVEQFEIEALEDAYKAASAKAAEANARVEESQAEIDKIEQRIPGQQERCNRAVRNSYFLHNNKMSYLDVILGAETFEDLIKEAEYFTRVSRTNADELNKLKNMVADLENAKVELDEAKAEADAQEAIAREALVTAQDERMCRQREGIEKAYSDAGMLSGAASLTAANSDTSSDSEGDSDASSSSSSSDGQESNSNESESSASLPPVEATGDIEGIEDGVDWHMTEEEFVNEWAPRIDAYFEGSPMAGTGKAFALASFRYCIDPRWSPAISNIESGKGAVCIRPHNAWGWGAADSDPYNLASEWDSWESAINTHVKGLAKGYGYTISISGAQKYCPPNWQRWYNTTLAEMAKI